MASLHASVLSLERRSKELAYIFKATREILGFLWTSDPVHCYLEVAETNSVVVEISRSFLDGEQVRDKHVNVNKIPAV